MIIKNCPKEASDYEFIVAYKNKNEIEYFTHSTNGFEAEKTANSLKNGIIIHNVRIQGKRGK